MKTTPAHSRAGLSKKANELSWVEKPAVGAVVTGIVAVFIALVYNGWVQNVPKTPPFNQLTCEQRNPLGGGCR